ncbi:MAG: ABC transporter ATP-binding protein [Oscillospiraceae bacterium]
MPILELNDVYFTYQNKYQTVEAVKGVSCRFERGTFYAIMGKSGSGKSTLLSLMAGLALPSRGEILCEGESTAEIDLSAYRRSRVAVIYQSFQLLPLLTAAENIMFPMELAGAKPRQARQRAEELVSRVELPSSVLDRYPFMLSGGEQQRVAIARALGTEAKILLADEPTGNLDTQNGENIIRILSSLAHEDGYCVIVVTHSDTLAANADEVLRMRDGKIYH